MRHRRTLTANEPDVSEINISPMIDMVFILLIFFIVTTVFVEEPGVEVRKPVALSGTQLEKQSILIAVTADGKVVYGGRDIGISGVRPLVRRLNQKNGGMPVILQVDQAAPSGIIVRIVSEAKIAGARVAISTEHPRGS